ncbi:MAG: hypothetical protein ACTSX9_04545 [Candidatus Njordarchaeales archaeon]
MGSLGNENLSTIIAKILEDLEKFFQAREQLIKKSRDIFPLIRDVFKYAHKRELEKAQKVMEEVNERIRAIQKLIEGDYRLISTGIWHDLAREYVEAILFLQIINKCLTNSKDDKLPTPQQLGVETVSWILGLCEVVGELKRQILLTIHNNEYNIAWCYLDWIRKIYDEVSKIALPSSIIPNLKAKIDYIRNILVSSEEILVRIEKKIQ